MRRLLGRRFHIEEIRPDTSDIQWTVRLALVAILVSACASQDSPYAGDACETIPASYCSREVGRCVGYTPDEGAMLCLDKSLADCDSCPDSWVVPTRFTLPDDDLPLAGACAAAIAKAQAAR